MSIESKVKGTKKKKKPDEKDNYKSNKEKVWKTYCPTNESPYSASLYLPGPIIPR